MRVDLSTAAFRLLRAAGQVLPLPILWLLLWPVALLLSIRPNPRYWPHLEELRPLPAGLRPSSGKKKRFWSLWCRRAQLKLTDLSFVWADRFGSPRWRWCRFQGAERLQLRGSGVRPVILVSLHFGPMRILGNWLRARGLPAVTAATVGTNNFTASRRYFHRLRDRVGGLGELPNLIETGHVGDMVDHLQAGKILIITADAGEGRHLTCPWVDGCGLVMHTGFLHLAALTGAVVFPCLITSAPFFGFTIHLGEPVPDSDPGSKDGHAAACEHILREFLPVLANAPEECTSVLFKRLRIVREDPRQLAHPLRGRAMPSIPPGNSQIDRGE